MDLIKLGYTVHWVDYGVLTEDQFLKQEQDFDKSDGLRTEHYRAETFSNWIKSKDRITETELKQFLFLVKSDTNELMAGTAITELYSSDLLTDSQFDYLTNKLPQFGDWTKKLITRVVLKRKLINEPITEEIYAECLKYKNQFKDNRLMFLLIKKTKDLSILEKFENNGSGKQVRTLASKKIKRLRG